MVTRDRMDPTHINHNCHIIQCQCWSPDAYAILKSTRRRLKIKNGPPGTPTRNPVANYQAPYRAAVIPIVTTNVGRARTLPDLDARWTGTGHGPSCLGPANMGNGFGQVMLPPLILQSPHLNAHA